MFVLSTTNIVKNTKKKGKLKNIPIVKISVSNSYLNIPNIFNIFNSLVFINFIYIIFLSFFKKGDMSTLWGIVNRLNVAVLLASATSSFLKGGGVTREILVKKEVKKWQKK